jgi:hypothetical protein
MLQNKVMIRRGRLTAIKGRKKEWKMKMEENKIASFRASNRHMAEKKPLHFLEKKMLSWNTCKN